MSAGVRVVRGPVLLTLALSLGALLPRLASAQDCSPPAPNFPPSASASTLNLQLSGLSASDATRAIAYWSGCSTYGTGVPTMSVGGTGGTPVSVTFAGGQSMTQNGRCGVTEVTPNPNGVGVASVSITLYATQANGDPCNPYYDELAHELGHALGLADAQPGATCEGHIMGTRQRSATRTVDGNDCTRADASWRVPGERPAGSGDGGPTPRPCV